MCGIAEKVGHHMVDGMAVRACRVIGPAYGVTVGHEPWPVSSIRIGVRRVRVYWTEAAAVQLGPLMGGQPIAPCLAPETRRSGLVGGVLPRNICPSPGRHQRWQEGR